ncbi:MAG: hypothetical protein FWF51_05880 [Chitinivibrionia bacterium]|nr:hypothetical protein [Chitinivibrionia bacterium]
MEKSYKYIKLYLSSKYEQIIIAPHYFNEDGLIFEQDICYTYSIDIDEETLGIKIIDALNKYTLSKKRYFNNDKLSKWSAFVYSKLKTIKSFRENYFCISISDENGYINFGIEYKKTDKYGGYVKNILKIPNDSKESDIGKTIREIYFSKISQNR